MNIHILEDDAGMRVLLRECCATIDHHLCIFCFPHAERYLRYVYTTEFHAPDLMIVDIELGGMNGLQLVDRLWDMRIRPKTLLITGSPPDSPSFAVRSCALLLKPFRLDRLVGMIQSMLSCSQSCSRCIYREEGSPPQLGQLLKQPCCSHLASA